MNATSPLKRLALAVSATVLLNVVLYFGLPMLNEGTERERSLSYETPILVANIKPAKPPEEIKAREIKESAFKKMEKAPPTSTNVKPKMDVSQFESASGLGAGIGTMAIGSMRDGSMKELGDMKTQLGKIEFELSEVDSPPQAIRKAPAVYPFSAKRQGLTGKVMIRCLVNVDGTASKHQIVESEPKGVFDEAALEALEKWRFKPGVLGGERVSTWVRVPFVFELN